METIEAPPQTPTPVAGPAATAAPTSAQPSQRQIQISQALNGIDPQTAQTVNQTFQNKELSRDQLESFLLKIPASDKARLDLWHAYYTYEPTAPVSAPTTVQPSGLFDQIKSAVKPLPTPPTPAPPPGPSAAALSAPPPLPSVPGSQTLQWGAQPGQSVQIAPQGPLKPGTSVNLSEPTPANVPLPPVQFAKPLGQVQPEQTTRQPKNSTLPVSVTTPPSVVPEGPPAPTPMITQLSSEAPATPPQSAQEAQQAILDKVGPYARPVLNATADALKGLVTPQNAAFVGGLGLLNMIPVVGQLASAGILGYTGLKMATEDNAKIKAAYDDANNKATEADAAGNYTVAEQYREQARYYGAMGLLTLAGAAMVQDQAIGHFGDAGAQLQPILDAHQTAAKSKTYGDLIDAVADVLQKNYPNAPAQNMSDMAANAVAEEIKNRGGYEKVDHGILKDLLSRAKAEKDVFHAEFVDEAAGTQPTPAGLGSETSPSPTESPIIPEETSSFSEGTPEPIAGPPVETKPPQLPQIPGEGQPSPIPGLGVEPIAEPQKTFTIDGKQIKGTYKGAAVLADGTTVDRKAAYLKTLKQYGYPELTDEQLQSLQPTEHEQVVEDTAKTYLNQVAEMFEGAQTGDTGKLIGGDREGEMNAGTAPPVRRIAGGAKEQYPFLDGFKQGPTEIAAAIRKGSGTLYTQLVDAATEWVQENQGDAIADHLANKEEENGNLLEDAGQGLEFKEGEKTSDLGQTKEEGLKNIVGGRSLEALKGPKQFDEEGLINSELFGGKGGRQGTLPTPPVREPEVLPPADAAESLSDRWHMDRDLGQEAEYWLDGDDAETSNGAIINNGRAGGDRGYAVELKDGRILGPFHDVQSAAAAAEEAVQKKSVGRTANHIESKSAKNFISEMKTGEGKAAAGMDPRLMKVLGAKLYSGDLGAVAMRELLQNAIDAVRGLSDSSTGKITMTVSTINRTISIQDNGHGMLPEVAQKELLDIGGSKKEEGSSGGFGIAKVALFANSNQINISTTARDVDGKTWTTRISGSGTDWANPEKGLDVETTQSKKQKPSGTSISIQLNDTVRMDMWSAGQLARSTMRDWLNPADLQISVNGDEMKPDRPKLQKMYSVDSDGAEFELLVGNEDHLTSWGGVSADVLNRGLFQFPMTAGSVPGGKEIPISGPILINIKPTGSPEDSSYPFSPDRDRITGHAKAIAEIQKFIKTEIIGRALGSEIERYRRAIEDSPTVGTSKIKIVDTTGTLDHNFVQELSQRPYLDELSNALAESIAELSDAITARRKDEIEHADFGVGLGSSYLGLNVHGKSMGADSNLILINPWTVMGETLSGIHQGFFDSADGPSLVAGQLVATMVHELSHQDERGHDEAFAGELTRNQGRAAKAAVRIAYRLESILSEANNAAWDSLTADTQRLQNKWTNGKDPFSKIGAGTAGQREHPGLEGTPEGQSAERPESRQTLSSGNRDTPEDLAGSASTRGSTPNAIAGPSSVPAALVGPRSITAAGKTYEPISFTAPVSSSSNQTINGWEVAPGLAVSSLPNGEWIVSHIPSGLRIANSHTRNAAIVQAERLAPLGDWTRSREDLKSDRPFWEAVQKKLRGERGSLNFWHSKNPPKIQPDLLPSPDPDMRRLQTIPDPERNIWQEMKAFPGTVKKFLMSARYNEDIKMWPVFAERVRRAQEIPQDAARQAIKDITEVLKGLDPTEYEAFRGIIFWEDMYETAARLGEDRIPLQVKAGVNVMDKLEGEINRLRAIATPATLSAVDRHHALMEKIWDDLVSRGKVGADSGRVKYFPNIINHEFGESIDRLPGLPLRMQESRRVYLKQRSGHTVPHDPDYIKVMEKYLTRVNAHNMTDDFIAATAAENDLMPKLTSQQAAQVLASTKGQIVPGRVYQGIDGLKYKGFQFNPGRVLYPVQAIKPDVIWDALDSGLDTLMIDLDAMRKAFGELPNVPLVTDTGEDLTHRAIAMGQRYKTYLLPIEIADKLEHFHESNRIGPFAQIVKGMTQAMKAAMINFNVGPYLAHVTLGNEISLYAEDVEALGRQKEAMDLLRGKLTGPQYQTLLDEIDAARIWNSVFYGVSRPRAANVPELRKFRKQSLSSAINPFGNNPIGDFLRAYQNKIQMVQAVPKVAKYLMDAERASRGLPPKTTGVDISGMPPLSPLTRGKIARSGVHPDYGATSQAPGAQAFRMIFPFISFHMRLVGPWLKRLTRQGKYFPGDWFLLAIALPLVVLPYIWNHYVYPDVQKNLAPWEKDLFHINYHHADGSPAVWTADPPETIAAKWFGVHTWEANLDKFTSGEWTAMQTAKKQLQDIFGYQDKSGLPTAPGAMFWDLLNPMAKIVIDLAADKDSFSGKTIVSKSEPNLWGDPSKSWPQTSLGNQIYLEYIGKKLLTPYMQFLQATVSQDPDSPLTQWLTTTGPFGWKRALGIRDVNPGATDRDDWYSEKNLNQSLYDEKMVRVSDAYVEWESGNISAEQRDDIIRPLFEMPGPNPRLVGDSNGVSDIDRMRVKPAFRIRVLDEILRHTTDQTERDQIAAQIRQLQADMDRKNYAATPKAIRPSLDLPPVPTTLELPRVPQP